MKIGVIYKATNIFNEKVYVGKTENFDKRIYDHFYSAYHENCHGHDVYFHRAIRKYGKDAFVWEVVLDNIHVDELSMYEIFFIALYSAFGGEYGYNSTTGGESGEISEETKLKISKANLGKIRTKEIRMKLSAAGKGKHYHNNETIKKLSEMNKGENGPSAKLSNTDVQKIRNIFAEGNIAPKDLAVQFNISISAINKVINNITWQDADYKPSIKRRVGNTKLSYEATDKIRDEFNIGNQTTEFLAIKYRLSVETIRRILRNEIWKK